MNWRDALASGRRLVLDGGTGSELRRRGASVREDSWSASANLEQADLLSGIHVDYIDAGADIITANTFATTRFVLEAAGLGDRFTEINDRAIEAARRARRLARQDAAIAGSLSCLAPRFDARAYPDRETEYAAYCELADRFAAAELDLVLVEMMEDTRHAPLACRAAHRARLPFWVGISCRRIGTRDGRERLVAFDDATVDLDAVLDAVLPFEPSGISVMHSPMDAILPALERVRTVWPGPLGAYAEIPYAEDPDGTSARGVSPADYARAAREWLDAGAVLVGGCCGTTPGHIRAVRALIDG